MAKRHIVILGGGISGLSLGWFLKQRYNNEISLTLLEKDSRTGGWIRSLDHEGFLFEKGPRSCRSRGTGLATLQLIEELGLAKETIAASSEASHRYLYAEGRLQRLPMGILSFLFSPLMRGVMPALCKEWRIPKGSGSDESIYDFISRRLNSRIADTLIDPLTLGIYAGDIRKLSIQACFPEMYRWEQKHGSLLKGMIAKKKGLKQPASPFIAKMQSSPIFTFKRGMETLIKALTSELSDSIYLGRKAKNVEADANGVCVMVDDGTMVRADHLFCAIPASEAAALLAPLTTPGPTASVAVVNLGWRREVMKKKGFGHLIPSKEKESVLGIVWDSCAFPEQNHSIGETRLTAMLGGVNHPEITAVTHDAIARMAILAASRQLGIEIPPDAVHVGVARNAIPQYLVDHNKAVIQNEQNLAKISSRLTLLGSSWHGVSVNDCIAEAKRIASL